MKQSSPELNCVPCIRHKLGYAPLRRLGRVHLLGQSPNALLQMRGRYFWNYAMVVSESYTRIAEDCESLSDKVLVAG